MSRIGNRVLTIPENVSVVVNGTNVTVKGPKGELSTDINKHITVKVEGNEIVITRDGDTYKNFHGTTNANIKNMIMLLKYVVWILFLLQQQRLMKKLMIY